MSPIQLTWCASHWWT